MDVSIIANIITDELHSQTFIFHPQMDEIHSSPSMWMNMDENHMSSITFHLCCDETHPLTNLS
jgi:hypothetical protein